MTFQKVPVGYHFCCLQMILIYLSVTKIFLKNICDNANRELSKVANWPAAKKLSVNAKNKKLTNNKSINIDNRNIEQVNSTNFLILGLNIDQDLSWRHHIKKVSSKTAKLSGRLLGIMIRARHYLTLKYLLRLGLPLLDLP